MSHLGEKNKEETLTISLGFSSRRLFSRRSKYPVNAEMQADITAVIQLNKRAKTTYRIKILISTNAQVYDERAMLIILYHI